jgi:hypothetical protein
MEDVFLNRAAAPMVSGVILLGQIQFSDSLQCEPAGAVAAIQ